ncbi:MAG: hypothetical protein ACJA0C_001384 [Candidatus Endobugula sp.]|jgi:uncharacterized protein YneF (UPF0154 family)
MAGTPTAKAIAIALALRVIFVITGLISGLIFVKYKVNSTIQTHPTMNITLQIKSA